MLSEDMWENLNRFYAWDRTQNPSDLEAPHMTPFRRLLGGSVGSEGLSDDEALFIDRALCQLKQDRPDEYRVLLRVHRDGKTLRWMETRGEGHRRTNQDRLSSAHQYVKGFLRGAEVA